MSSRRQMLEFLSLSRLPSEFQEVEYLESSGTQYIDTSVVPNETSNAILDAQFTNTNQQLCGLYGSSSSRYQLGMLSNDGFYIGVGSISHYFNKTKDTNRHVFTLDTKNKTLSIDNETYTDSNLTFGSNSYSFALFMRNNAGSIDTSLACYMRLYSCQIYNNDILIRDFVPCYRKADNVAGLYDLVNGVFYTNAGTGTFVVGGNV